MHPPLSASQVYNGLCDITMYRGGIVISRTLGILNLLALGALGPGLDFGIWELAKFGKSCFEEEACEYHVLRFGEFLSTISLARGVISPFSKWSCHPEIENAFVAFSSQRREHHGGLQFRRAKVAP